MLLYLVVFHGLLFLSLLVMSPLLDVFPGEYISCTLTTPRLNGGVGTPSASVKIRLPYSPVVAEIADSSADQWNRDLRSLSLIEF
jgi:hypothetical protein